MDKIELKKEILDEINGLYQSNKIDELVELFISIMQIKTNIPELSGIENRQLMAYMKLFDSESTINEIKLCLSDALKIEPLLKKVLYLVDSSKYQMIQTTNAGLSKVIEELGLNPHNKNLSEDYGRYENDKPHQNLLKAYKLRNTESHTYETWGRRIIFDNIDSIILTSIRAIDLNYSVIKRNIKDATIKNSINVDKYLNELIAKFKTKMSRFVHIRGEENFSVLGSYVVESQDEKSESKRRSGTVEVLRDTNIPEKRMMIWGEAGMGKSTTLEYLSYIDAKKRLRDENANIPVLVLLGILLGTDYSIKQYICDKLEITVDMCEMLLKEGKINLFIDGLNEIPNDAGGMLKTLRLREIKSLIDKYDKTFIIITNRPQDSRDFSKVPIFNLVKLSVPEIYDFIEKNVDEKEVKNLLRGAIDGNTRFVQIINTPLILSRLIEIVKYRRQIPQSEGEIIAEFLDCLFSREKEEKQDARLDIKKISYLLRMIAFESLEKKETNAGMKEAEILSYCKKSMKEYSFEYDALYAIEMAVQLGILEKKERMYVFSHQAYQDHYYALEELAIMEA